jgi:hypothetical protein
MDSDTGKNGANTGRAKCYWTRMLDADAEVSKAGIED